MDGFAQELSTLIVALAAIFLPGSAMLALSGGWRRWQGLQQSAMVAGPNPAFYPILYQAIGFVISPAPLYTIGSG